MKKSELKKEHSAEREKLIIQLVAAEKALMEERAKVASLEHQLDFMAQMIEGMTKEVFDWDEFYERIPDTIEANLQYQKEEAQEALYAAAAKLREFTQENISIYIGQGQKIEA